MGAGEELLQGIKVELQAVQLELQEAHSQEVELQECMYPTTRGRAQ